MNAIGFAGMRVVSAYQPIWGSHEGSMREYRRAFEIQVVLSGRERLVIEEDLDANVWKQNAKRGVCGNFGVRRINKGRRDQID